MSTGLRTGGRGRKARSAPPCFGERRHLEPIASQASPARIAGPPALVTMPPGGPRERLVREQRRDVEQLAPACRRG